MDWKVIAALALLGVAIAAGLVIVLYSSVSRYAKRFDSSAEAPPPPGAVPPERDEPR